MGAGTRMKEWFRESFFGRGDVRVGDLGKGKGKEELGRENRVGEKHGRGT